MKVEGLAQLDQNLKSLGIKVESTISRKALNEAAALVESTIRSRTPRLPSPKHPEYGHLQDNITVTIARKIKTGFHVKVGTGDGYWGLFLELGTPTMSAKPFFQPAWESIRMNAWKEIHGVLSTEFERWAKSRWI